MTNILAIVTIVLLVAKVMGKLNKGYLVVFLPLIVGIVIDLSLFGIIYFSMSGGY
jgi:hypothetical protein